MPIAVVTVAGLVNGVTPSAAPAIIPGGAPDGGSQLLQWEAELSSDTSSGVIAAGRGTLFQPWDHGVALAPGARYTARVRVQQIDWSWSPWAVQEFRVEPLTPPPPGIAITNEIHPSTGAPRLGLAIRFPQAYDQRVLIDVQREDPTYGWLTVAQRYLTNGDPLLAVDDYAVPTGFTGRYRVRSTVWTPTGAPVVSGWTYSRTHTAKWRTRTSSWLVDPHHPESAVRVILTSRDARAHEVGATGTDLLPPPAASIVGGQPHRNLRMAQRVSTGMATLPAGQMTVRCDDRATVDRALRLLSSGARLLFRGHREWDYAGRAHVEPDQWLHVVGTVNEQDHVPYGHVSRVLVFSWVGAYPPGMESLR